MRIIAGAFRGRRLRSPKGLEIRPTPDRVREAIFSIIAPHLQGAHVLDLYAGTGALGLEALSRGAERAVFVDQGAEAVQLIRANIDLCRVQDRTSVLRGSVQHVIRRLAAEGRTFPLIFMDPPYGKGLVEETLLALGELSHPDVLVVAEHQVRHDIPDSWGGWLRTQERRYGDTAISFFVREISH